MREGANAIERPEVASGEALLRYPGRGTYDGRNCICTRACAAACDGRRCGCEACTRSWLDHRLDELLPVRGA